MLSCIWKYKRGDRVKKIKGSSWQGHIVGFYSTSLTPLGYCIESEREPGSVQMCPETLIELVSDKDTMLNLLSKQAERDLQTLRERLLNPSMDMIFMGGDLMSAEINRDTPLTCNKFAEHMFKLMLSADHEVKRILEGK